MGISDKRRCRLLFLSVTTVLAIASSRPTAAAVPPSLNTRHKALLQSHCLKCHNAQKSEGKFRLDDLPFEIATVQTTERWQKVLNALNSNSMPPEDEKQPESNAKTDFLEELANSIVMARRNLSDQKGLKMMRRMNRREYKNTLRELLGVEMDVNELPSDTGAGAFDTMATNLFMSSDQFDQYLALGREALDEAFDLQRNAMTIRKQHFEAEDVVEKIKANLKNRLELRKQYVMWSKTIDKVADRPENHAIAAAIRTERTNQPSINFYHSWKKLTGAPAPTEFGFVDAETATHEGSQAIYLLPYQAYFLSQPEVKTGAFLTIRDNGVNPIYGFPVGPDWPPGEYRIRLRMATTRHATPHRRFVEFGIHATHLSTHEVLGTMESPQVIELRFNMTKTRTGSFFIRERGTYDSEEQSHRVFGEAEKLNGVGPEFALWIDWADVERIPASQDSTPSGIKALQIPLTDEAGKVTSIDVRHALERFGAVACRGSVHPPTFFDRLTSIYIRRQAEGVNHSTAMKEVLAILLSSPRFLYLSESTADESRPELSGNELAVRLAYFLWGGPPDTTLSELAARGQLTNPKFLEEQVDRLIDDPRSNGFITPFVHQWLSMERLDFFRFNNSKYPAFDESTKMAARKEVYETFGYLVRHNQSIQNLLKSDFVIVNSLLAEYYGIDGVTGDAYQKVAVSKDSPRGGLLGMAAVMAMGGNGDRTSPVERGAWVLRKLLFDPPPPAPANVPQISRLDDQLLTTPERLKLHQEQPQCASCHRKIDPIGFGLENFNAVGQWRIEDSFETAEHRKTTWLIDPSAAFHNGPNFKDYFELRDIVATKLQPFARGYSIALLEYALGRAFSSSDEPLITEMVSESSRKAFGARQFVHTLVQSKQFRSR